MSTADLDSMIDTASDLGREHGWSAASWVTIDHPAALLQLIHDGDPLAWTGYTPPLWGERADGYSADQLIADCGITAGYDDDDVDTLDEIVRAYEDKHADAWMDELTRRCADAAAA